MQISHALAMKTQNRGFPLPKRVRNILKKYNASLILPGEQTPVLGPELVVGNNLSTATDNDTASTNHTNTSFTTVTGGKGVVLSGLVVGRTYTLSISGTTTSAELSVNTADAPIPTVRTVLRTGFGAVSSFVANYPYLYLRHSDAATSSGISITCKEILSYSDTHNGFNTGNWTDSVGTTPATIDGKVGLVVDAAGVPGAELVTNGDFSNGATGWSPQNANTQPLVVVSGALSVVNAGGASDTAIGASQVLSLQVGKAYRISGFVSKVAGDYAHITVINNAGSAFVIQGEQVTTSKQTEIVFTATETNSRLYLRAFRSTATTVPGQISALFDNISVRELPGIHALQATDGFKPVERRGLVNQLLWSSDFSQSAWVKANSATVSGIVITCPLLYSRVEQPIVVQNATTYTLAARVKSPAGKKIRVGYSATNSALYTEHVGSDEFAIVTFTDVSAATTRYPQITWAEATAGAFELSGVALFQGTVTAQQIIDAGGIPVTTTEPASSALVPRYWQFDGVDDRLSLSAVPFQMSDDHWVVVACKQSSGGALQRVFHIGTTSDTPRAPAIGFTSSNVPIATWRDDAATPVFLSGSALPVGTPVVITGTKAGNQFALRVDGVLTQSQSSALGATTVTTATIGNSSGIATPFAGPIYCVIYGKGAITDAELLLLEKFAGKLAGVQI